MEIKENYFIQAAIELGVIENTIGYGQDRIDGIIKPDGRAVAITPEIEIRAEFIMNLKKVRATRDSLLLDTDWVGNTDVPDSELKTSLIAYRQNLRDVPSQVIEGEQLNINWPIDPRVVQHN